MAANNETPTLKQLFGETVELSGEDDSTQTYRIMAELQVGESRYAVLQSDDMVKEGEIEVFRLIAEEDGGIQLETVEDDDEWELVAEAYDDAQFGSDDQP